MIILYPINNCSGIFVPHFCLDLIKNKIQYGTVTNEKSMFLEIQNNFRLVPHKMCCPKTCRLSGKWNLKFMGDQISNSIFVVMALLISLSY